MVRQVDNFPWWHLTYLASSCAIKGMLTSAHRRPCPSPILELSPMILRDLLVSLELSILSLTQRPKINVFSASIPKSAGGRLRLLCGCQGRSCGAGAGRRSHHMNFFLFHISNLNSCSKTCSRHGLPPLDSRYLVKEFRERGSLCACPCSYLQKPEEGDRFPLGTGVTGGSWPVGWESNGGPQEERQVFYKLSPLPSP